MIHCLKIARNRLFLGLMSLNSDKKLYENDSEKFEKVYHLSKTLRNRNKIGEMKNFYVFDLFIL